MIYDDTFVYLQIIIQSNKISGHTKPPESSPEGADSPPPKGSPEPPIDPHNEMKSPHSEPYHHNGNAAENIPPMTHDIPPPMHYNEDNRMMQPFPFPPLLMSPQMDNSEVAPTDLRVMPPKPCHCGTSGEQIEEPQNLAYPRRKDSDSESDSEIDLTSHSKDDDLRESERLAKRIATSIFRSDAVLHDLLPNDLSMSMKNVSDRNIGRNVSM